MWLIQLRADREEEDERMTSEQLRELADALSILSAKSSVLQERDELRALMEEASHSEEVYLSPSFGNVVTDTYLGPCYCR